MISNNTVVFIRSLVRIVNKEGMMSGTRIKEKSSSAFEVYTSKEHVARSAIAAAIILVTATLANPAAATAPPAGYILQETITVPVNGSSVSSNTTLQSGVIYMLRATGTFDIAIATPGNCPLADAEFARFESDNTCTTIPGTPQDFVGAYDIGIGINSPTSSNSKGVTWSTTFNPTHQYTVDFTGLGAPISLNYHDVLYTDNSGSLTVEIFVPIPRAAPALGERALVLLLGGLLAVGVLAVRRRVTH